MVVGGGGGEELRDGGTRGGVNARTTHARTHLPRVIRDHDTSMSQVANDVIKNLVVRKGTVTAVVAHNKNTPHEKTRHQPVGRRRAGLLPPGQRRPHRRVRQRVHRVEAPRNHAIVKQGVERRLERRLDKALGGNRFANHAQVQRINFAADGLDFTRIRSHLAAGESLFLSRGPSPSVGREVRGLFLRDATTDGRLSSNTL